MPDDYQSLMQLAGDLALRAAGQVRMRFRRSNAWLKEDQTWVTDADKAAQEIILKSLDDRCPDHAVVAEEDLPETRHRPAAAQAEFCWVIDPLDGTHNFVRHVPIFSTILAVLHRGEPVAAAVADVMSGVIYRASAGGGAYADGHRLRSRSKRARLKTVVAFPSGRDSPTSGPILSALAHHTLRNLGSSGLHLAMVAAGGFDAAFGIECKMWDLAAGVLLVRQAGGRVTDLTGADRERFDLSGDPQADTPYIAGSDPLITELSTIIQAA
ncbi:MAG TPA: inositol monophosphatase [Phycisphaerae bacterium]|nr:inositol monophosphatase [Phycisphaerae bacterium]